LCPTVLEDNDIDTALQQLVENLQTFFSVKCALKCDPNIRIADNAVAVHLYRIAQECTTNAIKHGKATEILVSLKVAATDVVLRIQDNGCGLGKDGPKSTGIGLRVIQHRARMIAGDVSIRPRKEGGVVVTCTLPKSILVKKPAAKKQTKAASQKPHVVKRSIVPQKFALVAA
jgi:signal transduction histidine kinase